MFSMTILGTVAIGSIIDQVQAWDLVLTILFGNDALTVPAQIASWLAAVLTLAITAFIALKQTARILTVSVLFIEATVNAVKTTLKNIFWLAIALPAKFIGKQAMRLYRWAMRQRK